MTRLALLFFILFSSCFSLADDFGSCSKTLSYPGNTCPPAPSTNRINVMIEKTNTSPPTCHYYICPSSNYDDFKGYCSQNQDACRDTGGYLNPDPPPSCPTGWGGTGCDEWQGCPPSGYKKVGQNCVSEEETCPVLTCHSTDGITFCHTEYTTNCDTSEEETSGPQTTNQDTGCSIWSPDYKGQDKNNKPFCDSDAPSEDSTRPKCDDGYRFGYVNDVPTYTCKDVSADDPKVPPTKECDKGFISIDGECEKTGLADRDEKTDVQFNEDGSRTETTVITETYYNADGSVKTEKWTETEHFDSEGQKVGDTEVSDKQTEETTDNRASSSNNCASPPSCSGDAIQCSILRQNWSTMCAIKDSESEGLTGSELSDILSDALGDALGDGDSVTVSPSDFSDIGDVSDTPALTASDYDSAFSVEGGDIASIEALPDSTQIDVLAHVQEMELDIVISQACIPDIEITVLSAQVVIPLSEHCDFFKKVSYLVQFFFIYLVFRQFTKLISEGF